MSNNNNSDSEEEDSDEPIIPKGHHGLIMMEFHKDQ